MSAPVLENSNSQSRSRSSEENSPDVQKPTSESERVVRNGSLPPSVTLPSEKEKESPEIEATAPEISERDVGSTPVENSEDGLRSERTSAEPEELKNGENEERVEEDEEEIEERKPELKYSYTEGEYHGLFILNIQIWFITC